MRAKCLSVKQPYAYLIAAGYKTKEIRSWETKYRGDLIIVASQTPAKRDGILKIKGKKYTVGEIIDLLKENNLLRLGAAVCQVKLSDIKKMENTDAKTACIEWKSFFSDFYVWKLIDPKPLISTPVLGKLNIYTEDIKLTKMANLKKIF